MCETSLHNIDLGKQEPRGCRFIYGHPNGGEWHYCQRTIAEGGRLGDAMRPPYCARHTKVTLRPSKPFVLSPRWNPDLNISHGHCVGRGDGPRLPVHIEIAHSHKGLSHD